MTDADREIAVRVRELKDAFDRTFASPAAGPEHREEFLIVRADTGNYAFQLNSLAGLVKDRKIVSLPMRVAGLLGLAGFQGRMVPVFSLASLLGYGSETGPASWLAVCKAEETVALAFGRIHASARVTASEMYEEESTGVLPVSRRSFRLESGIVRVIDVPAVVALACERLSKS